MIGDIIEFKKICLKSSIHYTAMLSRGVAQLLWIVCCVSAVAAGNGPVIGLNNSGQEKRLMPCLHDERSTLTFGILGKNSHHINGSCNAGG